MRVRFRLRRMTQRVTLGHTAGLGIAPLLFLDLGKQKAKATMSEALALRRVDLMPGFACQSGVKRDLRQQNPTLEVRRVSCNETLCCSNTR